MLNEFLNYLMNDMLFHVYKNTKSWPVISEKFNTMFRKKRHFKTRRNYDFHEKCQYYKDLHIRICH